MQTALSKLIKTKFFHYLVIASVAIAVMLPILFNGLPYGYDLPHHFQCAFSYYEGIISGDFYPSWSGLRNYGFGGMELRLYPPISHYSLAVFYLISQDWISAAWLTITFYSLVGSFGVYFWSRELMSSRNAVFAGCVYALMPYHLTQIYNTFFYAEYVGSAIMPFSFWFVYRVCKRGKLSDVLGLGVSFAALILTHLPLTVIGAVCLSLYGLSLLQREKIVNQILRLTGGAAIGLAASSFFWLKVIQEKDLLAKTLIYADPWLDYRLHFLLTVIQTYTGNLAISIYENSTFFYDMMFFYAIILVCAFNIPFLIKAKNRFTNFVGVWLVFLTAVFLATPLSRPVWDHLPLLQEVQFPWRWVSIVSIFGSVLAASHLDNLFAWFQDKKRPFALLITGCFLGFVAFSLSQVIRQAPFIPKDEAPKLLEKAQTDKGFTFWWTIWSRKEIFENREKVTAEGRDVQIQTWSPTLREFQVSSGNTENARIATYFHPNWKATLNGLPVEIKPDANGAILIPLTEQKAHITLSFEETSLVQIGRWTAFAFWLCLSVFILLQGLRLLSAQVRANVSSSKSQVNLWQVLLKIYSLSNSKYAFWLLIGASFLTLLPMILIGVFDGGDLYQHAQFATTFQNAILHGDFYPHWGANENLGYGSNGVRFYPPFTPFLLGLMRIISGDWHTATWITFLFFTIIGSIGVYLWAKEFVSSAEAIWAGLIFILMPYHLIEINNASMYAEFAGCSVVSFSFLFVTRVCRRGNLIDVLGLAISYATLIFTHLPTTVIGSFCLFLYTLLLLPKERIISTLLKLQIAVVSALCATSVYWLKMITERDWMRLTKFWKDQHFDFHINFLLTSPWIDKRQLWFFNLVMLSLIFMVVGGVFAIYKQREKVFTKKLRGVIFLFFFAVFMTTILSQPIWETLPYLHEVQFPWRWLTIASVSGSVVFAVSLKPLISLASTHYKTFIKVFVVAVLIFFTTLYGLIWIGFQLNYIPAGQFEGWVVEKSQSMGAEWFWTTRTNENAFLIKEKVLVENRQVSLEMWQPYERVFTVSAGNPAQARVATLYYPHWKASLNDQPIELQIANDGAISIPLSDQKTEVKIWFEEPDFIKSAFYISLVMWLIFGVSLTAANFHKIYSGFSRINAK